MLALSPSVMIVPVAVSPPPKSIGRMSSDSADALETASAPAAPAASRRQNRREDAARTGGLADLSLLVDMRSPHVQRPPIGLPSRWTSIDPKINRQESGRGRPP